MLNNRNYIGETEMCEALNAVNEYAGVLSVAVSFITAAITLIYVIFTYKQMKATQDTLKASLKQIKVDKQPCIVYKEIKTEGTNCFYKKRRQLHVNLKLQNIGDAPAMSIYVFSHLELQYSEETLRYVNMEYLPDFVPFLKVGSKVDVSTRYETNEINLLLEDLSVASAKNIHRVNTDATKERYKYANLVIEIYYKNILGQWFKNERHIEVLGILETKENDKKAMVKPANSLKDNVWFELQLIAPAFSQSDIGMVDGREIKDKLKSYERYRPFVDDN